MNREPLLTVATITTLVAALIGLLVAFGLDLSNDQQTAILGVTAVVAPLVVGLVSRPKVTPVATRPWSPAVRNDRGAVDPLYALVVVLIAVVLLVVLFRLL